MHIGVRSVVVASEKYDLALNNYFFQLFMNGEYEKI